MSSLVLNNHFDADVSLEEFNSCQLLDKYVASQLDNLRGNRANDN